MIDLRSDTVTQPTAAMRRAIADADVGDDVFRDDPNVIRLEETVAELLGKDDAVYVPSGTMSNQIALRTHTEPGDVVLAARHAHILMHELGGAAALSGVHIEQLPSQRGSFTADAVRDAIPERGTMPDSIFQPITLVATENTHNLAGGTVWDPAQLNDVGATGRSLGLATHIDGARIWNAAVASATPERDLVAQFDTASVCFSKGLGAPMGSALAGAADLVRRARRFKQMFGGGFRQAGMMAAAALYALEHHRERLAEDHANTTRLAAGLAEIPGIDLDLDSVQTNMVYFDVTRVDGAEFARICEHDGVQLLAEGNSVRVVCHLQVTTADVDQALRIIDSAARGG